MKWLGRSQRAIDMDIEHDIAADTQLKDKMHKVHSKMAETNEKAKKLNALLRADGITLKIYIAKGGYHGR